MYYGFTITTAGLNLLAQIVAGGELNISRITFGDGVVPDTTNPSGLTNLIHPLYDGSMTVPVVKDNVLNFNAEYRNDMNGGLSTSFTLNEFGIFALNSSQKEVMIYYATLGNTPQYVSPVSMGLDARRFPVSVALNNDVQVTISFPTLDYVTQEGFDTYLNTVLLPQIQGFINIHNTDLNAHAALFGAVDTKIGSSADPASATGATLFSLLKFVANKFVSVWTDAKAALLDTISQYIGAPSDTASQTGNTLFALTKYTANNMALGGGVLRTYTRAISESAAGADIINYTKPIKIRRIYYSRTAQPGGWPEIHFDSVTVSTFTTLDTFPLSGQLIIRSLGDWAYAAPDYTGFAIRDLDIICRNSFRVHQGVQSGTPSSITIVYEDLGGGAI